MTGKKPFENLLDRVNSAEGITPGNRAGLIDFLEYEHPGNVLFTKWSSPPIIERGLGNKVWDVDGREYIDCISGMSTMNIGHGEPRVAQVLHDQYLKLSHWFDFPTPERLKLVKRLTEITPGNHAKKVRLTLSGSDAVENAIRLARSYTKRQHIISFYGAYHGQNVATMALTGAGSMHRFYNPVPAHDSCIERFPYPYCYRCPYNLDVKTCDMQCVKAMDSLMSSGQTSLGNPMANVNNIAAMIVEPMQSSSGYIAPPEEFLVRLRALADKYNFILIFDEVQTGMGRTGKMWACEHSNVVPDIIVMGKALGSGVPMGAIVGRAEYFDEVAPGYVVSTYAGFALGCAVANKVLDIYEEDQLVDNCAKTGEHLAKVVKAFSEKHPIVGTYSQKGVYLGIELVSDRQTKEPAAKAAAELVDNMREAGLLAQLNGYFLNRISFVMPIIIKPADIDQIFAILDPLTSDIEAKFGLN
jgi:4-aminobutyrate aminotransferase-like enzyme